MKITTGRSSAATVPGRLETGRQLDALSRCAYGVAVLVATMLGNGPAAHAQPGMSPGGAAAATLPEKPKVTPVRPTLSATDEIVVAIRVEGTHSVPESRVLSQLTTRIGRPYDPLLVRRDVKKLYDLPWFVKVDTYTEQTPNGRVVIFKVQERPLIRYIEYLGNNKIRDKKLAKETGLEIGDALAPYDVEEGRRRIEQVYSKAGYKRVQVTVLEGSQLGDRGVVYAINEGRLQQLLQTTFEGNRFASDGQLKTKIKAKPGFVSSVPGVKQLFPSYVDYEQIEADMVRLTDYYRSFGFFQAKVGRVLEWNNEGTWATLRYVIHEGPRSKVRNVSFVGNEVFATEHLAAGLKLPRGEPFERALVTGDVEWLKELYGSRGYVFADVNADLRFLEQPGEVDLVFSIDEGRRFRVGRIHVHIGGENPHTRIQTALNRLSFRPGEVVDIREVRASERRLQHSSLFLNEPARGIVPKITFRIPEDEDGFMTASRDSQPRGQSPPAPATPAPATPAPATPAPATPAPATPVPATMTLAGPIGRDVLDLEVYVPEPTEAPQPWAHPSAAEPSAPQRYQVQKWPTSVPESEASHSEASQPLPSRPQGAVAAYGPLPSGLGNSYQAVRAAPAAPQVVRGQSPYSASPYPTSPYRTPPHINGAQVGWTSGGSGTETPAGYGAIYRAGPDYPTQRSTAPTGQVAQYPAIGGQVVQATGPQTAATGTGWAQPVQYTSPAEAPGMLPPSTNSFGGPMLPDITPYPSNGEVVTESTGIPVPQFQDPPVDVFVDLQEAQTGRFMLGVGINSDAGLSGNILLDERNFDIRRPPRSLQDLLDGTAWRGAGQRFRLEAAPGSQVHRYLASFQEPFLFDTPISLSLAGSYYTRRYDDWDEERLGGRIGFGYQFVDRDVSTSVTYRGEQVKLSDPSNPAQPDLAAALGSNVLHGFRWGIINDTRDSPFLPTQGHHLELYSEAVVGTFDYVRGGVELQKYFLMRERADHSGRHVLSLATQLDITGKNTPIYDRFYAGGQSSLRGFDFRGASPVDQGVIVGGDFLWVNSAQYLFPVTADDMLYGVVFCDFGTVEPTPGLDDFRISPGVGLRITVPAMGPAPIALDFAWPVERTATDDLRVFSFSMGFTR